MKTGKWILMLVGMGAFADENESVGLPWDEVKKALFLNVKPFIFTLLKNPFVLYAFLTIKQIDVNRGYWVEFPVARRSPTGSVVMG
jgi:hypothetical protein